MKHFLLPLLLLLAFPGASLKAQYVDIPDPAFRTWLETEFPECMDDGRLDTLCAASTGIEELNITTSDVTNLFGLQFFKTLKEFICRECASLVALPALPPALVLLSLGSENLSTIQAYLPASLKYLSINGPRLMELPPLPEGLVGLGLSTGIRHLPPLPPALVYLSLTDSYPFSALPSYLPASLEYLYLWNLPKLFELPLLPEGLRNIDISYTGIRYFPPLPPNLKFLLLNENYNLRRLPTLPEGLLHLSIIGGARHLCLPYLPASMNFTNLFEYCEIYPYDCEIMYPGERKEYYNFFYLISSDTLGLSCVPNIPEGFEFYPHYEPHPICEDPEKICDLLAYAQGKIYLDLDNDDIFTPDTDLALPGQVLRSMPYGSVSHSSAGGNYWVPLKMDTENSWTPTSPPRHVVAQPSLHALTPTTTGLQAGQYDIVFKPVPGIKDLESFIAGSVMRPGFTTTVSARIRNHGTVDQSGIQVRLRIPEGWDIESADPPYTLVSGDTLIWENVDLARFTDLDIRVVLRLPATADLLGTTAGYEIWAYGTDTDATPADNYAAWQDVIRGSYDPNDKLVSPEDLSHLYTGEENILYTIRFQNTGTDTAFFVTIRDEFPENVDLGTLKLVNASHPCKFMILDKGVVEVFFDNILLPDSTTNEAASHGFVQFTVKPVTGLQIHDEIVNSAAIYFDYNEPIITNDAITTVKILSRAGVAGTQKLDFLVYPNPSGQTVRVVFPEHGHGRWVLRDISGRVVQQGEYSGHTRELELSVRELSSGTYIIMLQAADGARGVQKIVVTR